MKALFINGFCISLLLAGCILSGGDLNSARFCDEQGRRYTLPNGQTGLRALVFLDTDCELCKIEYRELLSHSEWFSKGRLLFIRQAGGNPSCRWPEGFSLKKDSTNFLFLSESGGWLLSHVSTFPSVLIIDEEGRVISQYDGLVSADFLRRRLKGEDKE